MTLTHMMRNLDYIPNLIPFDIYCISRHWFVCFPQSSHHTSEGMLSFITLPYHFNLLAT